MVVSWHFGKSFKTDRFGGFPFQMKKRGLTLLSFKTVLFKAKLKLVLIWKQQQSFLMFLEQNLITADMQKHSLTFWWLAECWPQVV